MEIYKGIGTNHCEHEELIDFLNYVFGMNGTKRNFLTLLPKLYKEQYRPEDYNFIVTEDGRLRAAVGAYPIELSVMGTTLKGIGIGNVAVHPFHRHKGYMKDCMKMALDNAMETGCDFAALGGQRQRYSYFGFEPAGVGGKFELNKNNLRHAFGTFENDTGFTVKKVTENDTELIASIKALVESRKAYPVRPEDRYFDVLSNWQGNVFAVTDVSGAFAGYYLYGGDYETTISEIDCVKSENAANVLRAAFAAIGADNISVTVPSHSPVFYDLLFDLAEDCRIANIENYCVYHYAKVADACLKLKADTVSLPEGEVTIEIDGVNGKEKLMLSVMDGKAEVTPFDGECDYHFTHRQAMAVLFGLHAQERRGLPAAVQAWLPLPLYVPEVDND